MLPDGVAARIQHIGQARLPRARPHRLRAHRPAHGRRRAGVYVLEANPNPQLAYGEDFAESAERAGVLYPALLERIVSLGLRWRPERIR